MDISRFSLRVLRWLYACAAWGAQPLLRRKLRRRAQAEPLYMHAVPERFGHYAQQSESPQEGKPALLWVHAVSLGETRTAGILLEALRARVPQLRVLLTHGTATGRAEGVKWLREGDIQVWQPWDSAGAVCRFLEHFRPGVGVLMDTEMWPHLVMLAHEHGVPMVLANARLNEKSFQRSLRLAALARPGYRSLTAVWPQTEQDAQRFRQLDAPVREVLGNIKFDAQPDAAQMQQGRAWRAAANRPVVLFASSREGEESQWLRALQALSAHSSAAAHAVQWLLVPRHPQRFGEVADLLEQAGWRVLRRSLWATALPASSNDVRPVAWLGDSMGEMALYYSAAHVALLGGSFADFGGQNLIEAAACACPVIMGPHTFNFSLAAEQAAQAGAALRVADMPEAIAQALNLVQDCSLHERASQAALSFAAQHRGAAARTAHALLALPGVLPALQGGVGKDVA